MEQNFARSNDQLASDRLKKAIERNRKKRAQKASLITPSAPSANPPPSLPRRQAIVRSPQRPSVVTPPKSTVSAPVNFKFSWKALFFGSADLKWYKKLLIYSAWAIEIFFVSSVVIGDRGVAHYLKHLNIIEEKKDRINSLQDEIFALKQEISEIRTNPTYQKKLIRDYLGYIAKSEYIIIFSDDDRP